MNYKTTIKIITYNLIIFLSISIPNTILGMKMPKEEIVAVIINTSKTQNKEGRDHTMIYKNSGSTFCNIIKDSNDLIIKGQAYFNIPNNQVTTYKFYKLNSSNPDFHNNTPSVSFSNSGISFNTVASNETLPSGKHLENHIKNIENVESIFFITNTTKCYVWNKSTIFSHPYTYFTLGTLALITLFYFIKLR